MKYTVSIFMMILGLLAVSPAFAEEGLFDEKGSDEVFNQGLPLYFQGNYTPAIQAFEEAIRINPENAKAYYFIVYSYYKSGQYKEASIAFQSAYDLNRKYSPLPQGSMGGETY